MSEDVSGAEPVTRRVHECSWSANLEKPVHADDPDLVVEQAKDAVEATADGYHVNLVTHGDHGHPESYLWPELEAAFTVVDGDADEDGSESRIRLEYVDQCGCGGHVTRVHVVE